jgi:hypothetical protein
VSYIDAQHYPIILGLTILLLTLLGCVVTYHILSLRSEKKAALAHKDRLQERCCELLAERTANINVAWASFIEMLKDIVADIAEDMDPEGKLEVDVDGDGEEGVHIRLDGFAYISFMLLEHSWEAMFFGHSQVDFHDKLRRRNKKVKLLVAWEKGDEIEDWIRAQVSLVMESSATKH